MTPNSISGRPLRRYPGSSLRSPLSNSVIAPWSPDYAIGDLVEHIGGLALAFTSAATKDGSIASSQGPSGDASRLGQDWRSRIPEQLEELGQSWRDLAAWEGMTRAGGIDLPAEVAGQVALNELVIHGWDLARASNQDFAVDPHNLEVTLDFVTAMSGRARKKAERTCLARWFRFPTTRPPGPRDRAQRTGSGLGPG